MAIQDDIAVLQAQIDAIKGNVPGTVPASCSIAGLTNTVADLEEQIKVLRKSQVIEDNPFSGTTMQLRLDARNVLSFTGTNQAAVAMINAIGIKPAAVNMGDVTVSVSGNSIVVSAIGETDCMIAAQKLAAFALAKDVIIDVSQVQAMKAGNIDKAEQYLSVAQLQEEIIATLLNSDIVPVPVGPDIGLPDVVAEDKTVVLDVVITGAEPITVDIDWEDGSIENDVTLPATHTYDEYGEYTITITATNATGSDSKVVIVETKEENE